MSNIKNPHDSCFQQLMQCPENALDFFQHYLEPKWQQSIDLRGLMEIVIPDYTGFLFVFKAREPRHSGLC